MAEGMPPDIVILPGCFPAFLMERQAFAIGRWTILLPPHPNAHPALGTLHQAASRRSDVVLLGGSRVVVTRVGGAGEDQFRPHRWGFSVIPSAPRRPSSAVRMEDQTLTLMSRSTTMRLMPIHPPRHAGSGKWPWVGAPTWACECEGLHRLCRPVCRERG
jgi:hypothetical protein